jgi:hypothetical protein
MLEISENIEIKKEFFRESIIYTIDNFYKDPDQFLEFLSFIEPNVWKQEQKPSNNLIHFEDRRHQIRSKEVGKVYSFLRKLAGIESISYEEQERLITTNFSRFKHNEFNDYSNNYWWPHEDYGHTAIIYLNKGDSFSGTNLYENLNPKIEPPNYPEHYKPWRNKKNYAIIKTLEPKFNRMILFNGNKFTHGMNICNDDYFGESYRMNHVLFLG